MLLALATAFVFTGQMEAAASHCARLASLNEAAVEPVKAETSSCHGHETATVVKTKPPAHHSPLKDRCECVAVLMACASVAAADASTNIEPYAWARPEAVTFASIEPSPDWRPPRA